MFDLKGRVAVVSGASSGLGQQMALALARQGANLVILARRMERLKEFKPKLIKAGAEKVLAVKCDVTSTEDINAAAKAAEEAAAAEAANKERRKDEYADAIGKAAAEVSDPDVADSLRSIESSVRKINRKIERRPELKESDSVRQLREIYLPKTMELVDKLTHQDAGPEAMLEIKGILNTCAVAYKSIVDKVYKREDEDTLIDIEVLKQTFEREGLLGSDFDVK